MAVPMKSEFGPTLGQILAPRWHAAPRSLRAGVVGLGVAVLLVAAIIVLTLLPASYSHGGSVPFHFKYKDLRRVAPEPGGYVRLESRSGDGALKYSFSVEQLRLAPYVGSVTGALPVYATGYIHGLSERLVGFELVSEGKARVNGVPGYQIFYTAKVEGREMYGRNVLLVPPRPGARNGVAIAMLTSPTASSEVLSPSEVASGGVLLRPLKTFTFG
jgi:hypothetical protein